MYLLAVDKEVDGGKQHGKNAASNGYAILAKLHEVEREVGGAKVHTLVMEDLGCLLEVGCVMDSRP